MTLSDFLGMTVVRDRRIATLVFDHESGVEIMLIGFFADARDSDLEIREAGWRWYSALCAELGAEV